MNLNKKTIFFLACFSALCSATGLHAQQAGVRAYTDSRKIVIGDQVRLWLEVKPAGPGDKVQWAAMPDSMRGLEIVEKGKIDTLRTKDTFLLRQRLLITGFDSGRYYIPSFTFNVAANGQQQELRTDSIPLEVTTVAVDTTKAFKPIKEIVAVKWSIWDYWKIILAALLLLGIIIFVIVYFVRYRKNKIPAQAKVPPEKAHEKALRLLKELKDKRLGEQERSKEYFSELSDIIRIYLEERFGITAMEQTTDELLALLKKQNDARSELRKVRPELKTILRTADLAKFAKANPLPHEYDACMAAAVEVVQRTQVRPEEGAAS
ncbi:DUF4381 family protein [Taibaiella koreensis]|uniref:DUF4381 family protein n=1 Tax=Taibaiella koreensis TaxID=1268548 RepID=UPI000E5A0925|nr:DUF4381 family protein [Taibaiella koreensis]